MNVGYMSLIDSPLDDMKGVPMQEFQLGPERVAILEQLLSQFGKGSRWDPAFVAWRPFMSIYLSSGCNPTLTKQYYFDIETAPKNLEIEESSYSATFESIVRLMDGVSGQVFADMNYATIEEFCKTVCEFFITQTKAVINTVHDPKMYRSTLDSLLQMNTWDALMSALMLYRHTQSEELPWTPAQIAMLQERLGEWLGKFLESFDRVTTFIDEKKGRYAWYCEAVKNVYLRVWSSALILRGRLDPFSKEAVASIPSHILPSLVDTIVKSPAWYDEPYGKKATFDALCNTFYAEDVNAPDYLLKATPALGAPTVKIRSAIDTLYKFYWVVKGDKLTWMLYNRRRVEFLQGLGLSDPPDSYLTGLYAKGFPEIKQGGI